MIGFNRTRKCIFLAIIIQWLGLDIKLIVAKIIGQGWLVQVFIGSAISTNWISYKPTFDDLVN